MHVYTGGLFPLETCFCRDAPLCIEVACGNGHFLNELAAMRPSFNYLGIDLQQERISRSMLKLEKSGLHDRLRFIKGDARIFAREAFSTPLVDELFVTFPDPWPKYRHRKNRLNEDGFFEELTGMLRSGGHLYWICDYYPQILDVIRIGRRAGMLNLHEPGGYALSMEGIPLTLYESRWRRLNRKIFYVCLQKPLSQ
jgi:tRNA (guanine-N7-)-methyltransferase